MTQPWKLWRSSCTPSPSQERRELQEDLLAPRRERRLEIFPRHGAVDLGERRVGVNNRAERRKGKTVLLRKDDLTEEIARVRMHDRGAEDPALRVDENLEEVVFARSVAARPVVVCERGAEDAMGNALLLRLPFAEAHVRDLGVGVRDPGRVRDVAGGEGDRRQRVP